MLRTLVMLPFAFAVLVGLGFPGMVARWFAPPTSPVLPPPAVAAAALPTVSPTVEKVALAEPSPTPPPATATLRATPQPSATLRPEPSATNTAVPPTATSSPVLVASLPPIKSGLEPLPKVGAREYVIVDGDSGAILLENAAHRRVAPASTTKIVTAMIALERKDWRDIVTASYDESELIDSTLMGLRPGDRITLEDLLYGLMLPSGNDAALAIATYVGGSRNRFVDLMNAKAADLGLANSHFTNPHGLDHREHYSSAFDMVQFARAGMKDPRFQALSAARKWSIRASSRTYDVHNLNRVLGQVPGADGVKIGFTDEAGRTIVASATRNGKRVYVGAFHSTDLVGDTRPLLEWAFKNWSWV